MFKKIADWLVGAIFKEGKPRWEGIVVFVFLFISPILFIGVFSYINIYHDLTNISLARRGSVANLTANLLQEKLDHLKDEATALAREPGLAQLIRKEKALPDVEQIFLVDSQGNYIAGSPDIREMNGKNFSKEDWYRGVSEKWEPYLSSIYEIKSEPKTDFIAVAAPVFGKKKNVAGVLVLQIRIDVLTRWAETIEVGELGYVYFVDRKGQVIANPEHPASGPIVSYSTFPFIQKTLKGQKGLEIVFNPIKKEERVTAYAPVPKQGWGVIAQQPNLKAFAERNSQLKKILGVFFIILLFALVSAGILLRALLQQARMEEEKEQFVHIVSHELNNPITVIKAAISNVANKIDGPLTEKQQHTLEMVMRNVDRLSRIINDLLDLGRMESRRVEAHRTPIDLAAVVAEAIQSFETPAKNRGLTIQSEIAKNLPKVYADPDMVTQVLSNLLANALRFAKSAIIVKVLPLSSANAKSIEVSVNDDGQGIPKNRMGDIFQKFVQINRPVGGDQYKGTGLGLAIAKEIITLNGGKIWAESIEGEGAGFHFTLPTA